MQRFILSLCIAALPAPLLAGGRMTVLHAFGGSDGEAPLGGVIAESGVLYGTTSQQSFNYGEVFSYDLASSALKILYSFHGGSDAAQPIGKLAYSGGTLYGASVEGGIAFCGSSTAGTVFAVNPTTGAESIVHSFAGTDGFSPNGVTAAKGMLYGTTYWGPSNVPDCGSYAYGVLFAVNPGTGAITTLHGFQGGTGGQDGANPSTPPIEVNGVLYGVTTAGGGLGDCSNGGCGTVYAYTLATSTYSVLYRFGGVTGEAMTPWDLTYAHGYLYGAAVNGGANKAGAIFSIDLATGAAATLYSFKGGATDGANPHGAPLYGKGALYGTTEGGGNSGFGAVYKITLATGAETALFSKFKGEASGDAPWGALVKSGKLLYGTTSGTDSGYGTLFSIKP